MNPADKPDLPAPDTWGHMQGPNRNLPLWAESTVRKLLADERRKVLEEIEASIDSRVLAVAHYKRVGLSVALDAIRALLERKEPTT